MDGLIRYLFFFFLYLSLCATAIGDLCDEFPDVVILINDGNENRTIRSQVASLYCLYVKWTAISA